MLSEEELTAWCEAFRKRGTHGLLFKVLQRGKSRRMGWAPQHSGSVAPDGLTRSCCHLVEGPTLPGLTVRRATLRTSVAP